MQRQIFTLEDSLRIGQEANAYARNQIITGFTWEENNEKINNSDHFEHDANPNSLSQTILNILERRTKNTYWKSLQKSINKKLRPEIKELTLNDSRIESYFVSYVKNSTKLTSKFSIGNCAELSFQAFKYIVDHYNIYCEIYRIENGDHVFPVLNIDPNRDPLDPRTWGANCVIADPLTNRVYQARDYLEHLMNYYHDDAQQKNIFESLATFSERNQFDPIISPLTANHRNVCHSDHYTSRNTVPFLIKKFKKRTDKECEDILIKLEHMKVTLDQNFLSVDLSFFNQLQEKILSFQEIDMQQLNNYDTTKQVLNEKLDNLNLIFKQFKILQLYFKVIICAMKKTRNKTLTFKTEHAKHAEKLSWLENTFFNEGKKATQFFDQWKNDIIRGLPNDLNQLVANYDRLIADNRKEEIALDLTLENARHHTTRYLKHFREEVGRHFKAGIVSYLTYLPTRINRDNYYGYKKSPS